MLERIFFKNIKQKTSFGLQARFSQFLGVFLCLFSKD